MDLDKVLLFVPFTYAKLVATQENNPYPLFGKGELHSPMASWQLQLMQLFHFKNYFN
jgi:hypothetical protein